MVGLADELLTSALRFADGRLQQLREDALADASMFLTQLGIPAAPLDAGQQAQLEAHLAAARTGVDLIGADIVAVNVVGALNEVCTVLNEVQAAIDVVSAVAGVSDLTALLRKVIPTGATSGLAQQLGVRTHAPDGLSITGGVLEYVLSVGTNTTIQEGPAALKIGSSSLTVALRLDGSGPRLALTFKAEQSEITVAGASISALLGSPGGWVKADLILGVDTDHGVTVGGGVATKITLPPTPSGSALLDVRSIGIEVPNLNDPANADDPSAQNAIDLVASLAGSFGGTVAAILDGVGVRLLIDLDRLRSGQSPVQPQLRAPTGVGLTLDAGVVHGGGYLSHSVKNGIEQFGGALDLSLGPIGVSAVGLLTVGGETGFSLIIVLSVRFTPPIDLTFGFTLNAVGGILGVQRILDTDALRAQLHNHAIDHLLFPDDPVAAAPAILETLGTVFPARKGGIVIGPMLQLGWGRPTSFVTASLGLVLSLPDPKVVILGQLKVQVPAPQLPIVDLKADVYGEFSSERVLILIMLEDSRVGFFAVEGDLGILLRFGSSPEFAISAGGFHPRFTPPPELADLRRLAVDVSPPIIITLRAEAYLALTTNTFQLGCKVELGADVGPISAHGHLEFDAIATFSPFSFQIDLSAGVSIRFEGHTIAGIDLHLHLQGPAPWIAHGTAEFSILWWDIPVDVGPIQWGDSTNPPPEPVHARNLVRAALSDRGAWTASLPAGADRIVALRDDPADTDFLVHPLGQLQARQSAVPLQTEITHVGGNPVPAEEHNIRLDVPVINGTPAAAFSAVEDLFPAGQFLDLTDDQKLSRPAFEPMPAGIQINPTGSAQFGSGEQANLQYETFRTDAPQKRLYILADFGWPAAANKLVLDAIASARSDLRAADRYRVTPEPIQFADAAMAMVTSTDTLIGAQAQTYSHAAETLAVGQQVVRLTTAVTAA